MGLSFNDTCRHKCHSLLLIECQEGYNNNCLITICFFLLMRGYIKLLTAHLSTIRSVLLLKGYIFKMMLITSASFLVILIKSCVSKSSFKMFVENVRQTHNVKINKCL